MSDTPRTDAKERESVNCEAALHSYCGWKLARALERELNALRTGVPYPEFCVHPDKCSGLSNCPRDPICAD